MADILLNLNFEFDGMKYMVSPMGIVSNFKTPVMKDANDYKACDAFFYSSHGEIYARIDDADYALIGQPKKLSIAIIPLKKSKCDGVTLVEKCKLVEIYYDDSNKVITHQSQPVNMVEAMIGAKSPTDSIIEVCDSVKEMLLEKNRKYGNSALNPCRVFSKADSVEQLKVRIDDKINRIKNEQNDEDEDVVKDLIGYLVLLIIARENNNAKETDI